MSDRWQIEPEPTEEELAALTAAIVSVATVQIEIDPEAPPASAWSRAARREAVETGVGSGNHWGDRF